MLTLLALVTLQGPLQNWQFVRPGILSGIGGMVLLRQTDESAEFLVVHDNKKEGQARVAVIGLVRGGSPVYREVKWTGSPLPVDLEYLCQVPGRSNQFLAGTSTGECYLADWNGDALRPVDSFKLPSIATGANYEGASLQTLEGRTWLVYGHRGALPEKARLEWCEFDLATNRPIGPASKAELDVPWPAAQGSRGVSDLKVDTSGTVYVTGAMDAGDDGPFQSVFFVAGVFRVQGSAARFVPGLGSRLLWTDQHKIEALELVPGKSGGLVLATDDENLGSSVWSNLWH